MRTTLFAVALLALVSCNGVRGSGTPKTETRSVAAFTGVEVRNGIEAEVTIGPSGPITVTYDDNLLPLIETTIEGGRLVVALKKGTGIQGASMVAHVVAAAPALDTLSASSGGVLAARGLRAGTLKVTADSGAHVTVAGTAVALEVTASSGGNLDAGALATESMRVAASSGASVRATVAAAARGTVSGGASVRVKGKPGVREITADGGGDVTFE